MSFKTYTTVFITVLALSAGAYSSQKIFVSQQPSVHAQESAPIIPQNERRVIPASPKNAPPAQPQAKVAPQPEPNITLLTGSTTYRFFVPEHTTLLDAMHALASSSTFTFSGKNFPMLGTFVDTINGQKNSDGYYWILYLNGRTSDIGASQTTLNDGDIVEWRYEKGY